MKEKEYERLADLYLELEEIIGVKTMDLLERYIHLFIEEINEGKK